MSYICIVKALRNIALIFGVFLLFLGNIGVDVYKHICEEDGVEMAYVINTIDHCDEHEEDLPPCCQEEEKEDDCCDDEVAYYQLKFDFFQQLGSIDYVIPQPTKIVWGEEVLTLEDQIIFAGDSDPPPLERSTRLSLHQTYLI